MRARIALAVIAAAVLLAAAGIAGAATGIINLGPGDSETVTCNSARLRMNRSYHSATASCPGTATTSSSSTSTSTSTSTTTTIGTPPPPTSDIPAPLAPGMQWVTVFNDEFSGPAGATFNHSRWTGGCDWQLGTGNCYSFNGGRERYNNCQVTLTGSGTVKLEAEPVVNPAAGNCVDPYQDSDGNYISGYLGTNRANNAPGYPYLFKSRYGYIEAELKTPGTVAHPTPGFFSAFWLLDQMPYINGTVTNFSQDNEIDILECFGNDACEQKNMNLHGQPDRTVGYTPNGKPNWTTGINGACPHAPTAGTWVRFGVDWEPGLIAFYINGIKCGETHAGIPSDEMYLILNLFVSHSWGAQWGDVVTKDPVKGWPSGTLEANFVRWSQQKPL